MEEPRVEWFECATAGERRRQAGCSLAGCVCVPAANFTFFCLQLDGDGGNLLAFGKQLSRKLAKEKALGTVRSLAAAAVS